MTTSSHFSTLPTSTASNKLMLDCSPSWYTVGVCLAGPFYGLTALGYIGSDFVPFLTELALHGKRRAHRLSNNNSNTDRQKTDNTLRNKSIMSRFTLLLQQSVLLVPKSWFTHFYAVGILSWCAVFACAKLSQSGCKVNLAGWVILFHLLRRLYECWYVHLWRPGSQMHVLAYVVGCLYYAFLPFVYTSPRGKVQYKSESASMPDLITNIQTTSITRQLWIVSLVALSLYLQYQQYRHHVIMANTATEYTVPVGGLFDRVVCPHYSFEILWYATITVLHYCSLQETTPPSTDNEALHGKDWLKVTYNFCKAYNPLILLGMVVINLSLSAKHTLEWYERHSPEDNAQHASASSTNVHKRYALIPGML
jgi:3-oxo-5-alpha-steroid 4-dehydrogenase